MPSCLTSCRQLASRCLRSGLQAIKKPSWTHLGSILGVKMSISCGRGCIFKHIAFSVLRSPKIAQDGPRWAQDGPRPQDGSKPHLKRFLNYLILIFLKRAPAETPRCLQDASKRPPRGPQEASKSLPRDPQEAPRGPKRLPKGTQDASKRLPGAISGRSWSHLGAILGHLGRP